jgi:dimethylamine/trimethylamine dehydrogenase
VHFLTPSAKVSEWTEMTMEQSRIQTRLLELGVDVHTAVEVVGVLQEADGLTVEFSSIHIQRMRALRCASVVMVTMRDPRDDLYLDLQARRGDWLASGVQSVTCIGDARAPGTVAAAVYAGHRGARELDGLPTVCDAVPFKRERPAL